MTLRASLTITALLLLGMAAGCATTTAALPSEKDESSSGTIRAAEEVGAADDPDAALHLQLAKEQYEYAHSLKRSDDTDRAERLLMRAQVDAELSLALARREKKRAEAMTVIQKMKTLKDAKVE